MTLEELLNKLIELGRKPRGQEDIDGELYIVDCARPIRFKLGNGGDCYVRSLNDLCSLDSGLRQFVCKKGLVKGFDEMGEISEVLFDGGIQSIERMLMLSSIQEDKEKFLLDNIAIGQH